MRFAHTVLAAVCLLAVCACDDGGANWLRQVTTDPDWDWDPQWSPDGTTIAFGSERSGSWDIWTVPAGGGTCTRITTDPADDSDTSWSNDRPPIAYE